MASMLKVYTLGYLNNECQSEWKGKARSLKDALKRSQIKPENLCWHHPQTRERAE